MAAGAVAWWCGAECSRRLVQMVEKIDPLPLGRLDEIDRNPFFAGCRRPRSYEGYLDKIRKAARRSAR